MMAIAFLGFKKYGPKWYKYNNNYNKNYNNSNLNNYNKSNKFKSRFYFHCVPCEKNSINKRLYGTESINKISLVVKDFIKEKNLNPVFIYENLDNQEIKNQIKSDSYNISGIYLILNRITGDYYIGSASTNKIHSRFYRHLINLSGSKIVKLAVIKYGLANFSFIVLELFPEEVRVANNKKLIDLEDFYLKSLLPNYNILTEAGSSFGYKHTEISRIKMKTSYSEERRNTIGSLNRHKILRHDTKLKMKEKALSRTAPRILSKEFLNNMKKNSKGIILYNLSNNTVYGEYKSILEASKCINCNDKTIRRALKTEKKILLKR
jgi:group I intron endonuclease